MAGIIQRYRARLPVSGKTPVVTLHEGDTPLVPAPRLAAAAGLPEDSVHLKLEGANPTGSFKDRGMTLAMSKALEEGSKGVLCASTGNTAASAAAYAARAGLPCAVVLPAGKVAAGKLAQAFVHGATVLSFKGGFDEALRLSLQAAQEEGWTVVNSTNPYRLQGQKTAAFEVAEALGRMPDYQFMPVGNAGNITAYWMGYGELEGRRPAMMGFQAAGSAPIVLGRPVKSPKTLATAIRIGDPYSWDKAVQAKSESGGIIDKVTDKEILSAYRFLAEKEGVFCEPSSAAGVAGLLKHGKRLRQSTGLRVVCILTGHGLKDPDAPALLRHRVRQVPANASAIRKALRCAK